MMNKSTLLIVESEAVAYIRALESLVPDMAITLCELHQVNNQTRADLLIADPAGAVGFFNRGGRVPWVQSTWAGVEPLVPVARQHNVVVTGLKEVFGPLASQYVFAHILSHTQRLAWFSAQQSKCNWQPAAPVNLAGRTLLVLGAGDIGRHVGQTAKQFAMAVIGVSRRGIDLPEFDRMYTSKELKAAVAQADYIVVCLPGTSRTSGIINKEIFNVCKPDACLINIGRANSVVMADLTEALCNGRLSHAIVDVLDSEPLGVDSPLWAVPNLTITPHVAAVSSVTAIAPIIAENLRRYQKNAPLKHVVDLVKGY